MSKHSTALLHISMNQPSVYICPLPLEPPSYPPPTPDGMILKRPAFCPNEAVLLFPRPGAGHLNGEVTAVWFNHRLCCCGPCALSPPWGHCRAVTCWDAQAGRVGPGVSWGPKYGQVLGAQTLEPDS